MRIIPAIDIIGGKAVRLTRGAYDTKKIYNEDPLEIALELEANGIRYLHLVDLDGAKIKKPVNLKILKKISSRTSLTVDYGGGLRTLEDCTLAFENGASQVTGGSIAVNDPELFSTWLDTWGADRIILGADCKNRMIATHGWQENSSIDILDFIMAYEAKGIRYVICTDIDKDGMLEGTANELYSEIIEATGIKLIASGGVSSFNDLEKLKSIGCEGAIVGKAMYEGHITIAQLSSLC